MYVRDTIHMLATTAVVDHGDLKRWIDDCEKLYDIIRYVYSIELHRTTPRTISQSSRPAFRFLLNILTYNRKPVTNAMMKIQTHNPPMITGPFVSKWYSEAGGLAGETRTPLAGSLSRPAFSSRYLQIQKSS
jgi:hypothetical protein